MFEHIKDLLFFVVAWYFRLFAQIRLWRWHPQITVVTGSSGKTTVMQLLRAQLEEKASFAEHANSAFGVPFDILGLHRVSYSWTEWFSFMIRAPFAVLAPLPTHTHYIVEADADRPGEGRFLASLLRPDYVLWISSARTHSLRFDPLVTQKQFPSVEAAIAYEFGYFLQYCSKRAWIVAENDLMKAQASRSHADVVSVSQKELTEYQISSSGTLFNFDSSRHKLPYALPEVVHYGVQMVMHLLQELNIGIDATWKNLEIPPGRNSVFKGIKDTTLIDSSYNANLSSMRTIINMADDMRATSKWAVIGDMLEQGITAPEQHKDLGALLASTSFSKVIFFGELAHEYTKPAFDSKKKERVESVWFATIKEVEEYLHEQIKGEELILFKGGRYQEAVVESLLGSTMDKDHLCRREAVWVRKRKALGLVG